MKTTAQNIKTALTAEATAVASYAIKRAAQANRRLREPLTMEDLKTKIGDHLTGRQEWPEFRGYMREGLFAVLRK